MTADTVQSWAIIGLAAASVIQSATIVFIVRTILTPKKTPGQGAISARVRDALTVKWGGE